ncbi:hypothetical protein HPP92_018154 [Vanilla planifolia]|uniref:Uncharacterized protein n=1 Tax=Vanilla planifolia TaxID=51239 RepID=A0A835QBH1_VANPL|nr:hypothetical protein HPP92_018154 [Vanilla planifolia]
MASFADGGEKNVRVVMKKFVRGFKEVAIEKGDERGKQDQCGRRTKGLNPGLVVLLVVVALLLVFFVGNYALYWYAQKTLPQKKKKPISKKKMKGRSSSRAFLHQENELC